MKAEAINMKRVVRAGPDTSVGEIAGLLLNNKISVVPVIDDKHRIDGIVSEGDLLGRPPSGSPRGWWLRLFSESAVRLEEIATTCHLKARDVMTSPVITVADQNPIDGPRHADAPPQSETGTRPERSQARRNREPCSTLWCSTPPEPASGAEPARGPDGTKPATTWPSASRRLSRVSVPAPSGSRVALSGTFSAAALLATAVAFVLLLRPAPKPAGVPS